MNPKSYENMNHLTASLLVEELVRNGVTFFCLSPGSRSTPLAAAVAAHEGTTDVVHFDERGAAYHALGYAKATGKPAALVCTSGTAAANYMPAVVEASASYVPLVVLTADRPPELLDCGANQAIDQHRLYGGYVRWSATVPCPDLAIDPTVLLTTVDQAVYRAVRGPRGPVHLNCMFREPLAPTPDGLAMEGYLDSLTRWLAGDAPYTAWHLPKVSLSSEAQGAFIQTVTDAERGWLVVGALACEGESAAALGLAKALGWPVFAEVTSGLRLRASGAPIIHHLDVLLRDGTLMERCVPGFVLHIGGPVVSKELPAFLGTVRPHYVVVNNHPRRQDPGNLVTQRIESDIAGFCSWLSASIRHGDMGAERKALVAASNAVGDAIDAYLEEEGGLNEAFVARAVSRHRPSGSALFLGNSMAIRDMGAYGVPSSGPLRVAANRGASGIDGNIATAAGYAKGCALPTTVVLGDLAALHDLNSLALLRDISVPFVLIVVNNDGGGIFSFLPVASSFEPFERYFGTPHGLTFSAAAELFGISYVRPTSAEEFVEAYTGALDASGPVLIEVRTERADNLRTHEALAAAIKLG